MAQAHEEMGKGQAERLMGMLQELLDSEGMVWAELDAIGVGTGPGNFTGTRIAVSAARGLALGLGVPAVGITTFDVVRRLLDAEHGLTVTVLPARGGRALYQVALDCEAGANGQAALAEFVCHNWLDHPAVIRVADPLPESGVYHVNGVGIDCDAPGAELPDLGAKIAPAIADIAAARLARGQDIPRPAPLYIRPADAAPPREAPPVILP